MVTSTEMMHRIGKLGKIKSNQLEFLRLVTEAGAWKAVADTAHYLSIIETELRVLNDLKTLNQL